MSISVTKTGLIYSSDLYESDKISFAGLPSSYTKLDYLEGTGTQQISCGFTFNPETDGFRIKYQSSTTDQNGMIFACSSGGAFYIWLYYYKSGSGRTYLYTNNSGSQLNINIAANDTNLHECYYINKSMYFDGVYVGKFTASMNRPGSNNMYLFSYGGSYYFLGKIYYLEVYSNNILTHHFIPAKNSDDKLGMYDLCDDTWHNNSSTGVFNYGTLSSSYNSQIISNSFMEI